MSSNLRSLSARSRSAGSNQAVNAMPGGIPIDGSMDTSALEILPNLLSPSHEVRNRLEEQAKSPWHRRPSATWLLVGTFIGAIAFSATMAPRVEIYIRLACQEIRPDYESISVRPGGVIGTWPSDVGAVVIPRPSLKCQSDSAVQAAVAELGATISITMGALGCLTAGWWGKLCDQYGRLKVLALTTFGVLVSDIVFISVALASDKLPLGYRFLIVAPIVEGLLGGIATGSAATHAYLSDTTSPANRAGVFSLMLGLLFSGVALGPTFGGLLISHTGDLLSVFYVSAGVHTAYLLCALFVVPESLSKEAALANKEAARVKKEQDVIALAKKEENMSPIHRRIDGTLRTVFFFFSPLSILLPYKDETSRRRDWNLTILAISYGLVTLLMGSYQFKFQYASYVFGWGSKELGYWLSVIGVMRALHLIVILPAFIKYFGPKTQASTVAAEQTNGETPVRGLPPHNPGFDLVVARLSLGVELIQYTLVLLSTNTHLFIAATLISSFSGGYTPSVQALAVELSNRNSPVKPAGSTAENFGQLFGALGVLQALCSQMIGPVLFGSVFVGTVDYFPKAIFLTGGCIVTVSLLALSLIRVVPPTVVVDEEREPLLPALVRDD